MDDYDRNLLAMDDDTDPDRIYPCCSHCDHNPGVLHWGAPCWTCDEIDMNAACRTCKGRGMLTVPDIGYESASEQACPDCDPKADNE